MDQLNSTMKLNYEFTWYDYTGFSIMLGLSALIGIYFGFYKGQSTANEYLLGGRKMKFIPIGVSLIASYISGISLLAVPTDVYRFGITYWFYCVNLFIIFFITYYVYLPVFFDLQLTSTYEYLELRFCKRIRILASFLYLLSKLLYLPIVIYIPALALSQAININLHLITPIVCGVCIFYTTIGGLKAVVWTDTLQFVVMMGSTLTVFCMGILSVGGFGNIWSKSREGERLNLNFTLDPTENDTVIPVLLGTFFYGLSYIPISQGYVQKYLALPTINDVKKALLFFIAGLIGIISLSVVTGLIMYARYHNCDPFSAGKITRQDQILPYYVLDVANAVPGLAGLFMSGLFSAALSTLSSKMNCLSASVYEDFVSPFVPKNISPKAVSNILKLIVLIIGVISTSLVFIIERMGDTILPISFSLAGITEGPLLGLFSLGMLFPIANNKGALVGGAGSILVMSFIIIGSQIYKAKGFLPNISKPLSVKGCLSKYSHINQTVQSFSEVNDLEVNWIFRINFYYYTLIGTLLVILIGIPISYFTRDKNATVISSSLISPASRWMINGKEKNKNYLEVQAAAEKLVHNK